MTKLNPINRLSPEEWEKEVQAELDNPVRSKGDFFPYPDGYARLVVGNGSNKMPLLSAIGVDRFGRLWKQDGAGFTLLTESYLANQ